MRHAPADLGMAGIDRVGAGLDLGRVAGGRRLGQDRGGDEGQGEAGMRMDFTGVSGIETGDPTHLGKGRESRGR